MPEITEAEEREYRRYRELGTPDSLAEKVKKAADLEVDNKALRDERRELKTKMPAEGAVVLTGDDATRWAGFQKLGKTPEELAAGIVLTAAEAAEFEAFKALGIPAADVAKVQGERDEYKQKDAARIRRDSIAAAVEAMGWPKETAATLEDMKSLDGAVFEVKTEKGTDRAGKETDVPTPYVTFPGEGQKAVKLAEFASKTDSLKGLRTSSEQGRGGTEYRRDPVEGGGTGGGYDPVAEGKRAAEAQKAGRGDASAAFT